MEATLLHRLNQLIPLSPPQQQDLCQALVTHRQPKGTQLLAKGEICDQIYFNVAGVLRSYCFIDGKEVTRWFCFPDHFATDYFSFVYRQPSENYLIASTDITLLSVSYPSLQALCQKDPVWIDLNRKLLEEYYLVTQDRVISFQTQSTAERYQHILQDYPDIEAQVSLGHLASFLGMSQETLSRLRHQRRQRLARRASVSS